MREPLPSGWTYEPVSAVADVVAGGTPARSVEEFWNGGDIPWVTPTDMTTVSGRFISESREHITALGLSMSAAKLLPRGSVLLTSRATLGEARIALRELCTNQGFKSLVPRTITDSEYLYYQLVRNKSRYEALGAGSTFLEVSKPDTERLELAWPSTADEQKAIASVLATVDDAIDHTKALIAKMKQVKAGMTHDLFTRGVTADGYLRPCRAEAPHLYRESPVGWIPNDWSVESLADQTHPSRPIIYGILMPGTGYPDGVPVVKVKDIVDGEISEDDLLLTSPEIDHQYERSRLHTGDLLLTIRGSVGRVAQIPPTLAGGNITQDSVRIGISRGVSGFFRYQLESELVRGYLAINTLGVAVQGVNVRDVRAMPVVVPDTWEQERITFALSDSLTQIRAETTSLEKMCLERSGLMHDLLTGRVRVMGGDETSHSPI